MSSPTEPRRSTTRSRRAMTSAGALTILLGVAGWAMTAGAAPAPLLAPSAISVSTTPAPGAPGCVVPAFFSDSASATVYITGSTYTVTVTATAPLCDPVTAAIYAMPSNPFWPWPQKKVEAKTFNVPAGVTTISFARNCGPLQFDIITGEAPESINPNTGPMPGPLLFAVPWTGYQSWLAPCGVGGTTTLAPTTTTTVPATTSTLAGTPTTTTAPATTTTTTAPATTSSSSTSSTTTSTTSTTTPGPSTTQVGNVLGETSTTVTPSGVEAATALPAATGTANAPEAVEAATAERTPSSGLAFTGGTSWPLEVGGTFLIIAGLGLVIFARQRYA